MNRPSLLVFLAAAISLGALLYLLASPSGAPLVATAKLSGTSPSAALPAKAESLELPPVPGEGVGTQAEGKGASQGDRKSLDESSPSQGEQTKSPTARLSLRWIDERSGEPAPFVSFSITDSLGTVMEGMTDAFGGVEGAQELATGPVEVTILQGAHLSDTAFGSSRRVPPRRRGGSPFQRELEPAPDVGQPSTWRVPVQRLVPVALELIPGLDPESKLEIWLGCDAQEGFRMVPMTPVPRLRGLAGAGLRGATHAFALASVLEWHPLSTVGEDSVDRFCWHHESAGAPDPERQLLAVIVSAGVIFSHRLQATELPRLGQAPLVLRPIEGDIQDLPGPLMQAWYQGEQAFQQVELHEQAEIEARPVAAVSGRLLSNTGTYRGSVHVRANPVTRNEEGGHDRRQQWITPAWEETSPGHFEAPFTLDQLDEGPYEIVFVPQGDEKVSDPRLTVDTTAAPLDPVTVTILD